MADRTCTDKKEPAPPKGTGSPSKSMDSLKRRTCATCITPYPPPLFQRFLKIVSRASALEKLPNSFACFVCGDRNPKGLRVRFYIEGDSVSGQFMPCDEHMGFRGITHGGIIAALLDEAMGWAPALANRRFCVTAE